MDAGRLRREELADQFEAESQRAWQLAVALSAQADLLHDQSAEQVERADFMRNMARLHRRGAAVTNKENGRDQEDSCDRTAAAVVAASSSPDPAPETRDTEFARTTHRKSTYV
jgi:hypothetical protein